MAQTFGQYLIDKQLPSGMKLTKPVTGSYLKEILLKVQKNHPASYGKVVQNLKMLGDKFSTLDAFSIGLDDVKVPNKAVRDALIKQGNKDLSKAKSYGAQVAVMAELQKKVVANDTAGTKDDVSRMVISGSVGGGKKNQIAKMRSSPILSMGKGGKIVPRIISTSYGEGLSPASYWNSAVEGKGQLVQGQLAVSEPGAMSKLYSNILNDAVVSEHDCRTTKGIFLDTVDPAIIDRYLANKLDQFTAGTRITATIQRALLKKKIKKVYVRSTETCEAPSGSLCSMCAGIDRQTSKPYAIGENVGLRTQGAISEGLTQLVLGSKHGTTLAKELDVKLDGVGGLNTLLNNPKVYENKAVVCELNGKVEKIKMAPQGGKYIYIRETTKTPDRFKLTVEKVPKDRTLYRYYSPPQRRVKKEIVLRAEVYPGQALTDGNITIKDVARLQGISKARKALATGMHDIYKRAGQGVDRRHFELIGRNLVQNVKIEKAPATFDFHRGEVVNFNRFSKVANRFNATKKNTAESEGLTLTKQVGTYTPGTYLTKPIVNGLMKQGHKNVYATAKIEVSPIVSPLNFAANQKENNWLSALNSRYLKRGLVEGAGFRSKENVHGYKPISTFAIGEMGHRKDGKY